MSVTPAPFSVVRWLGVSLIHLVEAPGAWLTGFIDNAEDVWASDPLLSEDDDQPLMHNCM